ncbi:hypothetical protein J6590_045670 [Homalodisca vitripennis]|nr:hypothetical protein J6590_045670 [Homalodisca vitripennis]
MGSMKKPRYTTLKRKRTFIDLAVTHQEDIDHRLHPASCRRKRSSSRPKMYFSSHKMRTEAIFFSDLRNFV